MKVIHHVLNVRSILLVMALLSFSAIGCNCEDSTIQKNPMSIDFLYPTTGEIEEGRIRVRVTDFNGVEKVDFFIGDTKIGTKNAGEKNEYVATQTFDLDAQPDTFTIKVIGTDLTGETKEEKRTVRKLQDLPQIRFTQPKKLVETDSKVFVGKKFVIEAESKHLKGIKEINLTYSVTQGKQEPLKQCTPDTTPDTWVKCTLDADFSADTYQTGDMVLYADSKSTTDQKPERAAIMQITLDKTGPQIAFLSPAAGNLRGKQTIRVKVRDQHVGVDPAKIFIFVNNQKLVPTKDAQNAEEWWVEFDFSALGSANVEIKATAEDRLGNLSEKKLAATAGCRTDNDCLNKPGTRCCLVKSPQNQDGKAIGQCFPVKTKEGDLCDPCTNPCGRGSDGQLMGCLPGACNRPPYQCRRACNLGSPNQRPDKCQPKRGNLPAEYCADSDITKINPQLGSCALGDNCDPFAQNVCNAGAKPPYNNCCPAGFGCFPADDDANICIPEGSKSINDTNCEWKNCSGGNNCKKGLLCTVSVDQQGRPQGPSSCSKMCRCDATCRALGADLLGRDCPSGSICVPVVLTNGRVPLPVGACVRR